MRLVIFMLLCNLSQHIYSKDADTTFTQSGLKICKLVYSKNYENYNRITLKNKSQSSIYLLLENNFTAICFDSRDTAKIYLGKGINTLDDIEAYELYQLKKGKSITLDFDCKNKFLIFELSILTENRNLVKRKGKYFISNPQYYSNRKVFIWSPLK